MDFCFVVCYEFLVRYFLRTFLTNVAFLFSIVCLLDVWILPSLDCKKSYSLTSNKNYKKKIDIYNLKAIGLRKTAVKEKIYYIKFPNFSIFEIHFLLLLLCWHYDFFL